MKVAVVGGGSTYTPELVSGLSRLDVDSFVLHDIDAERREVVGGLAARMLARQGYAGSLDVTDQLERAVDGADFVLIQIRVGGQAARLGDETAPLACGCIGQETTGAGGLAKALRTVPVVLEIAERVRELSNDAWIVDFTNPVGIVTRALLDHDHKAIGLCNVAIGFQRRWARELGVEPHRVVVDQVGLNHLTWVRRVLFDGDDILPRLLADQGDELAVELGLPRRLLDELGVVPSYYLRYFYAHDEVLREQLDGVPRAQAVADIERELLRLYRDPHLVEKPALLEQRGGAFYSEAALGLVASLVSGDGAVHEVDVRNAGTLEGLAADDVVEVPARVTCVRCRAARAAAARAGAARPHAACRGLRAARPWRGTQSRCRRREEGPARPSADRAVRDRRAAPRSNGRRGARVILAVDGGNSKTDVALVELDGAVIAHARGPLSSPHHIGLDGCLDVLQQLVDTAGLDGRRADFAQVMLAGVDFPEEEARVHAAVDTRGWATTTRVANDTFAVLRAGTERGWGVAITCGAGINCVGVAPDGRHVRFPALGPTTGDWGGGYDVGEAGLYAAARSEDGRGPATELQQLVPAHFGLGSPLELARQIHVGAIPRARIVELAPVVLGAAAGDVVAAGIRDRLVDEIVALARATVVGLGLEGEDVEIVVGGGLMRGAEPNLLARLETGLRAVGPGLSLRRTSLPPIVGAALLGLDAVGASREAQARVRAELAAAVEGHERMVH